MANHFQSDLKFIRASVRRTPDILVISTREKWEIKSPIGDGKYTIQHNLYCAMGQSKNIILDLTRCKMHEAKALARIRAYLREHKTIPAKLKVIKRTREVIDIIS